MRHCLLPQYPPIETPQIHRFRAKALRGLAAALLVATAIPASAQSIYFPPNTPNAPWETTNPADLGWCQERIDTLYAFLEAHHTKGFTLLKDGRIVLEQYFGTFTRDSLWYWASAGKSLTAMIVGTAQEDGLVDINAPTSTYLGAGWTSATPEQEAVITVRHQLTMTTGLDDMVPINTCTAPECLTYLAPAGTRWAYHTGAYALLLDVVANASGQPFNTYFATRFRNRIGMNGAWLNTGNGALYFSNLRSMARFGLLAMNNMIWGTDTILRDTAFIHAAITPSQPYNLSYGYLWWLNGQPGFMLPQTQFVFPGPLIPNATMNMYCGLGLNEQIINVAPDQGIVIARMGEAAGESMPVSNIFNDQIWQLINTLACGTGIPEPPPEPTITLYPNPAQDNVHVALPHGGPVRSLRIMDTLGRTLFSASGTSDLTISQLPPGIYWVAVETADGPHVLKLVKE